MVDNKPLVGDLGYNEMIQDRNERKAESIMEKLLKPELIEKIRGEQESLFLLGRLDRFSDLEKLY